jgi:hypothetical protein
LLKNKWNGGERLAGNTFVAYILLPHLTNYTVHRQINKSRKFSRHVGERGFYAQKSSSLNITSRISLTIKLFFFCSTSSEWIGAHKSKQRERERGALITHQRAFGHTSKSEYVPFALTLAHHASQRRSSSADQYKKNLDESSK